MEMDAIEPERWNGRSRLVPISQSSHLFDERAPPAGIMGIILPTAENTSRGVCFLDRQIDFRILARSQSSNFPSFVRNRSNILTPCARHSIVDLLTHDLCALAVYEIGCRGHAWGHTRNGGCPQSDRRGPAH